jgi:hypothetical protein
VAQPLRAVAVVRIQRLTARLQIRRGDRVMNARRDFGDYVLGMKYEFPSALAFYQAFDPTRDPRYFDNAWGAAELDRMLAPTHL